MPARVSRGGGAGGLDLKAHPLHGSHMPWPASLAGHTQARHRGGNTWERFMLGKPVVRPGRTLVLGAGVCIPAAVVCLEQGGQA